MAVYGMSGGWGGGASSGVRDAWPALPLGEWQEPHTGNSDGHRSMT
jgi:hypothetical protein